MKSMLLILGPTAVVAVWIGEKRAVPTTRRFDPLNRKVVLLVSDESRIGCGQIDRRSNQLPMWECDLVEDSRRSGPLVGLQPTTG